LDFLLECIGFPPDHDLADLERLLRAEGEAVAWRGPSGTHLRYPLRGGLEVRLDQEDGQSHVNLWPHFDVPRRLRVALTSLAPVPDSPFDALLHGTANPPLPGEVVPEATGEEYALVAYLSNARQLPRKLPRGHVIAVSVCGFALDVSYLGPNQGVRSPAILDEPCGAELLPLAGDDAPGGCMELSLRVRSTRQIENPLTKRVVDVIEVDAPGRPLELFLSPWQLAEQGFQRPRPGWRIEGVFLFTGRVSGGLPNPRRRGPG